MAASLPSSLNYDPLTTKEAKEERQEEPDTANAELAELLSTLPRETSWTRRPFVQYQGFWFVDFQLPGIISLQKHFKSESTDVLLASYPKAGTTWLMALVFAIKNRTQYNYSTHPLLAAHPHDCVPILEFYAAKNLENPNPDCPILATHLPYNLLPASLLHSGCRNVYVLRDPKDVFISFWYFTIKMRAPTSSIEEAFDMFCNGISGYGPYWDHVIGYWKASLEWPEKVLLLKYEDMKRKPLDNVKKLADFIGYPFSSVEELEGIIDKIISLCSFENLSSLEVNKTGTRNFGTTLIQNNTYFRQGRNGDWKSHITKEMAERIDHITTKKFEKFGLVLDFSSNLKG